jgi:predicted GNAT family acetyltransferase
MAISVESFGEPAAFLRRAQPFLERQEAVHNLLLGVAGELSHNLHLYGPELPWMAALVEGDQVIGAALRTPPHRLSVSLLGEQQRAQALAALAQAVVQVYPTLPGVSGPSASAAGFAEQWRRLTGQPFQKSMALRIYALTQVVPPTGIPGSMRRATEADRALLREWLGDFQQDSFGERPSAERIEQAVTRWLSSPGRHMFVWEHGGQALSMCGCAGLTPHGIRIGAVYTPPALRRRGYASACVAAASQHMLDSGREFCFLYTDLANPTSNKIYQQIGYQPVCDCDDYDFEQAEQRA